MTARANFAESAGGSGSQPRAALAAEGVSVPVAPFTQCPAVGSDTSCGVLVQIADSATTVYSDPSQGPYDGVEDTLIGVVNASSKTVSSIALSSDTDLFGFDRDGICTYSFAGSAGCPYGPTGYEGPNTSFSDVTPDLTGGVVNFKNGLAPGASAYFSLEEALTATAVFSGGPSASEQGGPTNPSEHITVCFAKDPVNCATGAFVREFADFTIPGRGAPLDFRRTYNSSAASTDGPLGFGWTHSYQMSLIADAAGNVTVKQENGSTVPFVANGSGGYNAPPRVLASLARNGDGTYSFTRRSEQISYLFSATGQLTSQTDLNGYTTTLGYTGPQLTSVTDPAGRKLILAYSGSHVSQVTDPLGRTVKFNYDSAGDLTGATDPAGRPRKFTYDTHHLLVTTTDPRGGTVTNTYDSSSRVVSQVDAAGLKSTWVYDGDVVSPGGGTTTMTDEHGNVTVYNYANLELTSVVHGAGSPAAATTSFTYDPATLGRTSVTDPNGHITTNTYDRHGNLLTTTDPLKNTTTFSYDNLDELTSERSPAGETVSLTYDGHGNLLSATSPSGKRTSYAYGDPAHPGDVTSVTDPDGRVKTLTYDAAGDVASVSISPSVGVAYTTASVYDADGELVCQVSPNETVAGVSCPAPSGARIAGLSTWSYDPDGEMTSLTDASGRATTNVYDSNGNVTGKTDALGNLTTTTFDADDRPLTVTKGTNGSAPSTTRAAYDLGPGTGPCTTPVAGATYCTTVTDPNGNVTVDYFSARDQLLSEVRPGGQTTLHAYDLAGNQTSLTDAAGQVTTFSYDPDDRITAVTYSDGITPNVAYAYDADGRRTSMTDGTGTTSYSYDADSRPTTVTNGAGNAVGYVYDGAGNVTSLTYPGAKTVKRGFDGAGRMTTVTDPAGQVSQFSYDADNNVTATTYPNGDTVSSTFDRTDQLTTTQVAPTATPNVPLISLTDLRNADDQLTQETAAGSLSGAKSYDYDAKLQLTKANGEPYTYDLAGNPTQLGSQVAQTFDAADQLTTRTDNGRVTKYRYDKRGNRIEAAASTGASAAYAYDQADRLKSATVSALLPAPVVTSISPASGPAAGGTAVTVSGTGFTGATAVTFGAQAATYKVVSDTTITATSPSGSGTVHVSVTTPSGASASTSADQFTYAADPLAPVVRRLFPSTGRSQGGNVVLILGERLGGATGVQFGTTPARFYSFPFLGSLIIAISPPGTGTVDVTVTTPHGISERGPADRFSYNGGSSSSTTSSSTTTVVPPTSVATGPAAMDTHATYSYDGDGLRVAKQTEAGKTPFTWDLTGNQPHLLVDGSTSFIYGPDGLPMAQTDGAGSTSYFFHDHLGSTRALLDSTGQVAATFTYDAYGRTTAAGGTARTPLLFTGGYNDTETGFYYLIARYYDPVSAQFLSRDPIEGITGTPYAYASGDPVNNADPLGLCSINPFGKHSCVAGAAHAVGGFVVENRHAIVNVGITIGAAAGTVAICGVTVGIGCAAAVVVGVGVLGVGAHVGSDAVTNDPAHDLSLGAAVALSGVSALTGGICAFTLGQGCFPAAFGPASGLPRFLTSRVAGSVGLRLAAGAGVATSLLLKYGINRLFSSAQC